MLRASTLIAWSLCLVTATANGAQTRLAVLGDSDSHAYQDSISFSNDPASRGGAHRALTFQWVEILARLRGDQVDVGPWGRWGVPWRRLADALEHIGVVIRVPRKEDYRFNFAISGAVCADLHEGPRRQLPRLLAEMASDSRAWVDGVVVIRIGTNDIGTADMLERMSRAADDPVATARLDGCLRDIGLAVRTLRERHPETNLVIVGAFNNAHWARMHSRWQSAAQQQRIAARLERFDAMLRAMSAADARVAFFDDQSWFYRHWGGRGPSGEPAYAGVRIGRNLEVQNRDGDDLESATLADGHAGTVWNALWAQSLVDLLRSTFNLPIRAIEPREVEQFIQSLRRPGR